MKDGSKEASFMAQAYRGEREEGREQRERGEGEKRLINMPRPHFN